ncbi:8-oxo-dGTP diphosphatase [Altererythrobacter xiamenensis]|uniref:8-oxo-dGTP diphosphatase n=1 Tax=Altererythrobacter xiamenensis TaxID=1316679 RepID=A0A1Y6FBM0_9SPHN|nr:NUDIX domain-containing protein [Altererythrobacter xiamenensis]SMQ69823.1 8-oxo-dGTP diphosphatase [Altererythrobacter xiamenensis]
MNRPPVASDLGAYPSPHLAVDIVLFTIEDRDLKVLTIERSSEPFAGCQVLPGDFVHPGEDLDATARRVLAEKAGLADLTVEQLYTFSAPDRDPRGWVVSTAYLALVAYERLYAAAGEIDGLRLPQITADADGDAVQLEDVGEPVRTGFDHGAIIHTALVRLRGKLEWSSLPFDLLPERFTLLELQNVHETILGRALNKPHFRKKWHGKMLPDGSHLEATGEFTSGRPHRPAEFYQLKAVQ